ncbi:FAD-dependent monooxygenase [Chitinophaga pendula]|uniref:FAD-dependent oxidoreductase n=1 Tax=Chitinophaga TaxID=79328 RepID=UPI000BAE73B8|nr:MULTISPECIES: FAD-dependent oxidoreductase [Chitinophaga]ASZ13912.1 hypothetical protein CK934_24610 [Chitinophaga sp. MD30]UCJ08470.1 FAD-dependent monooxygenase [Chitinophaga pendula]
MKQNIGIQRTQVLIVGGGITGLSAALFLAQQGIAFILIEKHKGTSIHPRARTIDIRTMELFRGLELHEVLREGGKALAPAWGILRGNDLASTLATTRSEVIGKSNFPSQLAVMKALADKSPETVCRCTQDISEAIIRQIAEGKGMDLRFYHEMIHFEQDETKVTASIKNRANDDIYTIRADYMIAADGANSAVRRKLAIPTTGAGSWTDLLNIYFDADLGPLVKGKEFSQFLIETPEITGFLLAINNQNRWTFHLRFHPESGESPADYPTDKLVALLRRVIGIKDLEISIISVLPWQLTVKIASYLRVNNIFIAGDAAHTMTPYAGKGANTGIQDVHNLAWKLAAVLRQQAGRPLLDTYNVERQPVGAFYANLSGEMADKNGLINEVPLMDNAVKLFGIPDYHYQSSAIVGAGSKTIAPLSGEPGTRMPHLWVDEAQSRSTLDWVKGRFILVVNDQIDYWQSACDLVREQMGICIHVIYWESSFVLEKWQTITQTTSSDALLIRPDDFVAAKLTINEPVGQLIPLLQQLLSYYQK